MTQNLLPLLFRPLRLVMSADSVRNARIILLKATHFPLVALIVTWESWRLSRSVHGKAKSSFGWSFPSSITAASLRRPLTPLPLPSAEPRQAPLGEQTRRAPSERLEGKFTSDETLETLETAVEQLRLQLDGWTNLLKMERRARQSSEN